MELKGLCLCGGNICRFDFDLPMPSFGVVAAGATVGEARKGRLVPHHHFFMAYGDRLAARCLLSPDDVAVTQYLGGEELSVENAGAGYAAVLLKLGDSTVTLGGGKLSGGRLKNYYPKGLRIR